MLVSGALAFSSGLQAATLQYLYDELGRLIAVVDPSADVTQYSYDEVGNLLSVTRSSASQVSILNITPGSGLAGQPVTIIGTAFGATPAQNQVLFNGTAAVVTAATATSLVVPVPVGATSGPISVTSPAGTATSSTAFVVREAPQIASFSPAISAPGGILSVTGRGFSEPDLVLTANTTRLPPLTQAPTSLTATIPSATGGKITVTTSLGTATTSNDLFIVPPPRAAADVAATGRITIGGTGNVLALPGGKVGLLLFDGAAGASGVRISLTNSTLSGALSVFGPDGAALASSLTFDSTGASLVLASLPVTGTYGVMVEANAGAGGNVTVTASTVASGGLSAGDTIVLSVAAGQTGTFTFSGTAGDSMGLEVASVSMPSGGSLQVIQPNGSPLGLPTAGTATFAAIGGAGIRMQTLIATGTYKVVVTATGGAGSARITLWKDVAGSLTVNALNTLSIPFRNQQARLTFTGAVGDSLGLDLASLTLASGGVAQGGSLQVIQPNGSPLGLPTAGTATFPATVGAGIRMQTLIAAGTYTVVIVPNSSATGTFNLVLWSDVSNQVTFDTPFDLNIAFRNQQARLKFNATAGQNGGVNISPLTLAVGGSVQVIQPNGSPLGLPTAGTATFPATVGAGIRMQPLIATGVYTVTIVPDNGATGTARVTVWNEAVAPLQVGTQTSQTVRFPNEILRFSFTGAIGDSLGLDLANLTMAGGGVAQGGSLQVIQPNGSPLGLPTAGTATFPATVGAGIRMQTLIAAGTYTVAITTNGNATGTLNLTLWSDVSDQVTFDTPYDLNIAFRNQQARLKFNATAGQNGGVNISPLTLAVGGSVQVIQPNGSPLGLPTAGTATFPATVGAGIRMQPLIATGVYTVAIVPDNGAAGTARVTVWNEAVAPLQIGTQTPQTVRFPNEILRRSFSGTAGDFLGLDLANLTLASSGVARGGSVQVIQPNGSPLGLPTAGTATFAATTGAGIRLQPLPSTGTHTVVVTTDSNGTGTFNLTLWRDVPDPLTIGTPYSLSIPFRNQATRLTFVGAVGDILAVQFSNVTFPGGASFQILMPSGQALGLPTAGTATFTTAGATISMQTLPTAGTYTLVITPSSSGVGGATVTVFRP